MIFVIQHQAWLGSFEDPKWKIESSGGHFSIGAQINWLMSYLQFQACRREALAHGNGVTTGVQLLCQCLNPDLERLVELKSGTSLLCWHCGGCFLTGKSLLVLASGQAPKCCVVLRHGTVFGFGCCALFYVALLVHVPSTGKQQNRSYSDSSKIGRKIC